MLVLFFVERRGPVFSTAPFDCDGTVFPLCSWSYSLCCQLLIANCSLKILNATFPKETSTFSVDFLYSMANLLHCPVPSSSGYTSYSHARYKCCLPWSYLWVSSIVRSPIMHYSPCHCYFTLTVALKCKSSNNYQFGYRKWHCKGLPLNGKVKVIDIRKNSMLVIGGTCL